MSRVARNEARTVWTAPAVLQVGRNSFPPRLGETCLSLRHVPGYFAALSAVHLR